MNINKELDCDVLIVGGGIAGLIAAERALKVFKRVCIADSSKICSGASYFPLKATLGIQATKDENDYDKYYEDITNMGKGVENPELIKTYIKNIKRDVYLLKRIGFKPWLRKDSRPACFAKCSRNIFLINDWNGARKRANKIFRKNKRLKIYFSSQVKTCPPTFNIQVNSKGLVHFSYKRYLENKIRENFDLTGTPIILQFKNKNERE